MHRLTMSYFYTESDKRFQDLFERYISVVSSINIPNLSFGFYMNGNSINFVFEGLNQDINKGLEVLCGKIIRPNKVVMKSTRLF